ncbi:hypothetical protein Q3W71_16695 [Micromonospora sp. C28SCA-DRY-2]|uniref:hypothetical protein n=1 Tax=Micromonospora sp. C28SCA-DRY-2 TaxID=3059522 RepID=UPI002676CE74|nr:hypothetical protein [Micromonospora sp. C28SCA-DRY-2]MDO3703311.1 hypothetical protein [Micromonospora sp. C28SCA-DRY-2]
MDPPAGCRIVTLAAGLVLASILACLAGLLVKPTAMFFTEGDFSVGSVLLFVVYVVIMCAVLYAVGALARVYLRMGRTRTWLRGTVLVERRIVLRRKIDLSTARVELRQTITAGDVTLILVAIDQRSGRSLELTVVDGAMILPGSELTALARAIVGVPSLGARAGDDHANAMIVAGRLSELTAVADERP